MATNPQPQPPPPAPPPPPPQPQPPPPPPGPAGGPGSGGAGGAAAGAGDPQLVAMIVNHLKSQGLFDQFRRDCLADVDTKPAYQNLRQRVDSFVANHLATHTWSPHLNKNQLRNNIRQQVLKSGMLESGIDRIISQVVDPKINHTFRPQVEKAVHEFLATLNHKEEASGSAAPEDEKADSAGPTPGVPAPGPSAHAANDALSILETITSLNQEASAARASTEAPNAKSSERGPKKLPSQPSADAGPERERTSSEDMTDKEKTTPDTGGEAQETAPKSEEPGEPPCPVEEAKSHLREITSSAPPAKDAQPESSEQKSKSADKGDKKPDSGDKGERKKDKKEKAEKKAEHAKRGEDVPKGKDEKAAKEKEGESAKPPSEKSSSKARSVEGAKEDCSPLESDVDGLTDITVSSVHTSDLSSFEEDTEEEVVMSDSMEEGEITSDEEEKGKQSKAKTQASEPNEGKAKGVRQAYVHKPYLYSKYYSDSDDELTVEQRRQSIAKEKEERLLRRQINREKLEEKRKQKAEKTKSSKAKGQGKSSVDVEESSAKSVEPKAPRIKEVLKERKVLEKKVALSKKRKKDSRNVEENSKKKQQSEEDAKETLRASEHCDKEKLSSSKDVKHVHAKSEASRPARRLSESLHAAEESKNDSKIEREHKRRTSTPVVVEGAQEDTETRDGKRQVERSDAGTEEPQKQKGPLKTEKHVKKDDSETPHVKSLPKKEAKPSKEKPEREKVLPEDRPPAKHKYKGDGVHRAGDEAEPQPSEKGPKGEESVQKPRQPTALSSDDRAERKSKHRSERKLSVLGKDGKPVSEYIIKSDENVRRENSKKERHVSADRARAEHKSRRWSDSRMQRDSPSARQHGVAAQRRSESCSEDRCDADSTNSDGNLRPEEAVHRDKRRTKSLLDEKLALKSKSKGQGKQLKGAEADAQESVPRQAAASKPDREKNTEESDPERQRKSKAEDRPSEDSGPDAGVESAAPGAHGAQREPGHRTKAPTAKERYRGDRDPSSSSRLERRLSDGHRNRSLKHSSKDVRKKEESRAEDKDGREVDSNHEKARGAGSGADRKLSRRPGENRRGSLSQEVPRGEEKPAAAPAGSPSPSAPALQRPRKSGDATPVPESEPMEVDPEPAVGRGTGAQPDGDSDGVARPRAAAGAARDEPRAPAADSKPAAPASRPGRGADAAGSAEKHADHRSSLAKKGHGPSAASRAGPGEQEASEQGAREATGDADAAPRPAPRAPSEGDRAQKPAKGASRASSAGRAAPADPAPGPSAEPDPSPPRRAATVPPEPQAHDVSDDRPASEGGAASSSPGHGADAPDRSVTVRGTEGDGGAGDAVSTADALAGVGMESKGPLPGGRPIPRPPGTRREAGAAPDHRLAGGSAGKGGADRGGDSADAARAERDVGAGPSSRPAAAGSWKDGATAHLAAGPGAAAVPQKRRGGPGGAEDTAVEAERRRQGSEVDTSAGSSAAPSVSPQRRGKAESQAGPGRAERTHIASSSGGQAAAPHTVKAGAATTTTTSAEPADGRGAVPCSSIEADEGVVAAAGSAAAEEGGAVVTEGFADSEPVLTSTKEAESGPSATVAAPARAGRVAEDASSAAAEEKDDAVSSAGSQEKRGGGGCPRADAATAAGSGAFPGEGESDGAVTSAGTDVREGALGSEEAEGLRGDAAGLGPKKEPEGAVTCTGAEGRGDDVVMCSGTGAGPPEERRVTGAAAGREGTDAPPGTSGPQEGAGSAGDGPEGESAVTSTGITEEDGEGPASCTGSAEGSGGFALGSESEENAESAMDSTVAPEASAAAAVAPGPCDDEGVVTSTGAKEDDDEGEGVVTSTGRGNEVGPAATCAGLEEEGEGPATCQSAGQGDVPAGTPEGHVEAEAGAAVALASGSDVDSLSGGAGQGGKDADICSSAKGLVESSLPRTVPAQGPLASAARSGSDPHDDGPLARRGRAEGAPPSAGLVGGSYEALASGAAPACGGHRTSAGTKEAEGVITSVEQQECDGRLAAHEGAGGPAAAAGARGRGKGVVISTSSAGHGAAPSGEVTGVEGGPSGTLRTDGVVGGAGVGLDEFEAPMPSAASGAESQPAALRAEDKDECAMISTSLGEEFEVPISSATASKFAESQPPGAPTEEGAKGPALASTDDFEGPMPSAPADAGRPCARTRKEDRDECALISTSIAEECEASVPGAGGARGQGRPVPVTEEKDGSAIISTSSVEDCEGPVSSALPPAAPAEEQGDVAVISTSTSEGCEAAVLGAVPREPPGAVRVEDASDAALISTSTAECGPLTAGLDGPGESPPSARGPAESISPASTPSSHGIPMPSLVSEDSQQPGPAVGGPAMRPAEPAGAQEGQDSVSVARGRPSPAPEGPRQEAAAPSGSSACLSGTEKRVSACAAQREGTAEATRDGPSAAAAAGAGLGAPSGPGGLASMGEGAAVGAGCVTPAAARAGAPAAGKATPSADAAASQPPPLPNSQGPHGALETAPPGCASPPKPDVAPPHAACDMAPPAPDHAQEGSAAPGGHDDQQPVPASSETAGDSSAPSPLEGGLAVSPAEPPRGSGTGNAGSPLAVSGGAELKDDLSAKASVSSGKEPRLGTLAPPESPRGRSPGGGADLQSASPLASESPRVDASGSGTNADVHRRAPNKEEAAGHRKGGAEAPRGRSVEAHPKEAEEEEKPVPRRKRKKPCPSSEDEPEENPDALDSKTDAAPRPSSGAALQDAKAGSPGASGGASKTSSKTSSTVTRAGEERDASSSAEATGEKPEPHDEEHAKSQEEDPPVVVKRKRGRPRKHPIEAASKAPKEDCRSDAGLATVEPAAPSSRLRGAAAPADEPAKEAAGPQEQSLGRVDAEEKAAPSGRRRGRKPKRALATPAAAEDTEASEPERKRPKAAPDTAAEDKKEPESEEEEEEEEEEEPAGATTRSAARSEAQRSKAQPSPPAKRKRDCSPPGARTRGQQQRADEAPAKKAKR